MAARDGKDAAKRRKVPADPNEILVCAQRNDVAGIKELIASGLDPR